MRYVTIIALLGLTFCGAGEEQQQKGGKNEDLPEIAQSVLMVIAHENFQDREFSRPHDLLTDAGIEVTIASTDTTPATGMLGMTVTPDIIFDQAVADSFDALIIAGGSGCSVLWDNTELHTIVQQFNDQGKTIAAICLAPVILARAGILKNKTATVYTTARDDIGTCGAQYTDDDIVQDSNIITGSGPEAAGDFAETILNTLSE